MSSSQGKRLAPMLAVLVPILRRYKELDLTDAEGGFAGRDERGHDRPSAGR